MGGTSIPQFSLQRLPIWLEISGVEAMTHEAVMWHLIAAGFITRAAKTTATGSALNRAGRRLRVRRLQAVGGSSKDGCFAAAIRFCFCFSKSKGKGDRSN